MTNIRGNKIIFHSHGVSLFVRIIEISDPIQFWKRVQLVDVEFPLCEFVRYFGDWVEVILIFDN